MQIWTTIFFSIAQQLYRLSSMSMRASCRVLKCVYFIPVSCLISTSVPAVTPQGVQALDLMWLEVTWCWLVLWCVYFLFSLIYEQFRSNTLPDQVCGIVLSGGVSDFPLAEIAVYFSFIRVLWLKSKAFQCSAGCGSSPSVADLVCIWQICFW